MIPLVDIFHHRIRQVFLGGERAARYGMHEDKGDGGYDQQRIYKIGEAKGWKGNTFMKAVRAVVKFDINKESELQKISKDWYDAVIELSENPELIKTYLQQKGLQKENP